MDALGDAVDEDRAAGDDRTDEKVDVQTFEGWPPEMRWRVGETRGMVSEIGRISASVRGMINVCSCPRMWCRPHSRGSWSASRECLCQSQLAHCQPFMESSTRITGDPRRRGGADCLKSLGIVSTPPPLGLACGLLPRPDWVGGS